MGRIRRVAPGAVAVAVLVSCTAGCNKTTTIGGSYAPGVQPFPSAAAGPAGARDRVAIHTASQQDIAELLKANGVSNPGQWAQIVMAYRPYPPNDPTLAKLRRVLLQYHADPDTLARTLNALTP